MIKISNSNITCKKTLPAILKNHIATNPDKIAYIFLTKGQESDKVTYQILYQNAIKIAAKLQQLNLQGERVLLLYPSSIDFIAAFMGCLYAGAIAVPSYLPENPRIITRIKTIIADCKPKAILSLNNDMMQQISVPADNNNHIKENLTQDYHNINFINTSILSDQIAHLYKPFDILSSDIAFLQYTSGSTSNPKGAMITHQNIIHNLKVMEKNYGLNNHSVTISWLPIHHDMGLVVGLLESLYLGSKTVFMSPNDFMKAPLLWLKAITKYHGTFSAAPNFAYDLCNMKKISPEIGKKLDLSSWQAALNGAEPIKAKTLEKFTKKFAKYGFKKETHAPSYGMAEATVFISACKYQHKPLTKSFNKDLLEISGKAQIASRNENQKKLVSCGRGEMMKKLWIVEPNNSTKCQDGFVGEIWVQDDSVARGYWHKEELTREIFNAYEKTYQQGPFLRTGDLGFIYQGELYITGRYKDLIIIRGQNIYPQDIELITEEAHSSLRKNSAACFAIEKNSEEQLVIIQEIRGEQNFQEIFYKIMENVSNEYALIPYDIVFIKRGTISKTTSGKIQRQLSKKLYLANKLEIITSLKEVIYKTKGSMLSLASHRAIMPKTNIERSLASIWRKTLHLKDSYQISIHDNFFLLGGNSILAANMISQIQLKLHKNISFKLFFNNPTIIQLANEISTSKTTLRPPLMIQDRPQHIPLSFTQERLWFLTEFEQSPNYNIAIKTTLKGMLQTDILLKSLKKIIKRHEILRCNICHLNGRAIQKIHNKITLPIEIKDVSKNISQTQNLAKKIIEQDANTPFKLSKEPLFRIKLIKLAPEKHILYINIHHIISDGSSIAIFHKELNIIYNSYLTKKSPKIDKLPIQYADYSIWQRKSFNNNIIKKQLIYWHNQLATANHILDLPTDYPRPQIKTNHGSQLKFTLDKELITNLTSLARTENVSLFMIMLSGLYILLRRYTGQQDISIGIPIAGRTQDNTKDLIGFFVNSLVMRIIGKDHDTVRNIIEKAKITALNGYEHQDTPFEQIVEMLQPERDLSRSPLFQVMLAYQNISNPKLSLQDITAKTEKVVTKHSDFDLSFVINSYEENHHKDMEFIIEYNIDLFHQNTIKRIAQYFINILQLISDQIDSKITQLDFLDKMEKKQILIDWNNTTIPYSHNHTIDELCQIQAKKTPDKIAVIYQDHVLTYQELDRKSTALAIYLQSLGVESDQIIALCVDRSLEMVITVLGILKAGAAYLPLDPEYPMERLTYMVSDSKAQIIITQHHLSEMVSNITNHTKPQIVLIEQILNKLAIINESILHKKSTADNLAYVIYTSGSTGKPKGVMVEHHSLVNHNLSCIRDYQINASDIILQASTISFDIFLEEVFPSLISGATLTIMDHNILLNQDNFALFIKKYQPTILNLSTSLWNILYNTISSYHIKLLIVGGETIKHDKYINWHKKNKTPLINAYGTTETSITSIIYKEYTINHNITPIGKPIDNTQIYILDEYLNPVPIGVTGEIYIAGAGVARGYLNNPELTKEKFIANPFTAGTKMYKTGDLAKYLPDGNIVFLGRIDQQVKIRGFRIEIAEIESIIATYPKIIDNIVIVKQDDNNKQLICYYVSDDELPQQDLRKYLAEKLPNYMMPAIFIKLAEIPLTPSGKTDRKSLANKEISLNNQDNIVLPQTKCEKTLVKIWQDILNIKNIGINDNYFHLGGDSIKSIQIISKAREYKLHYNIKDLFQYQTIKELAAAHMDIPADLPANNNIDNITGEVPLTPIQLWFFERQKTQISHWNQSILLNTKQTIPIAQLKETIAKLLNYHDSFKLRYKLNNEQWQQYYNVSNYQPKTIKIKEFDISNIKNSDDYIKTQCELLEQTLNIVNGPMINFAYFHSKKENYLFIAVHHLVIDGVSWRIILNDLNILLQCPTAKLPAKTTSYKKWSEKLYEYVNSKIIKQEISYWHKQYDLAITIKPVSANKNSFKIKDTDNMKMVLPAESTRKLLNQSNHSFKTEINDLLLTALLLSYQKWTNNHGLQIDLEGHGRENINDNIDISRTVGWFTSIFPVIFSPPETSNLSAVIKYVKQVLRTIPNKGIGFSVLKYLSDNIKIKTFPKSQIAFNYLGEFNSSPENIFTLSKQFIYASCSPETECHNQIAINGLIKNKELFFLFTYNAKLFTKTQINKFTNLFKESLEEIIIHCSNNKRLAGKQHIIPATLFNHKSQKNNLITFTKEKSEAAIFTFPGILGIPSYYYDLLQMLNLKYSSYGINNYNILEQPQIYQDIVALAIANAEFIVQTEPGAKTYYLLGHSFGSIVAYETAWQLEQKGYDVVLIVCDQDAKWQANDFSITDKKSFFSLFLNIATLLQIENIQTDFDFMNKWQTLYGEDEVITMLHKLLIWNNANIYLDDIKKLFNVIKNNYKLPYQFNRGKTIKQIISIKAQETHKYHFDSSDNLSDISTKWAIYSKNNIIEFSSPGNHFSMFHKPNISELSAKLQNILLNNHIENTTHVA